MRYINELRDGGRIQDVYLCKAKSSAVTKNGKSYGNVTLQDKTGSLDCKIWEPTSPGIGEFEVLDYVYVSGSVSSFNGYLQASLTQVRKADEGEYIPADYLPVTRKNRKAMYSELVSYIGTVEEPHLKALLNLFFNDPDFVKNFCAHSAAKTIHHNFIGGLLEHTLSVVRICDHMIRTYETVDHDLLITAAILHDVGKIREISDFPLNDYTDEGQLMGHISVGTEMIHDRIKEIEGFPALLEQELKHCILAHHGEYEFGSPKKPAIIEALALNLADNMDAKMEAWSDILRNAADTPWQGYNRMFETNIRKTEK